MITVDKKLGSVYCCIAIAVAPRERRACDHNLAQHPDHLRSDLHPTADRSCRLSTSGGRRGLPRSVPRGPYDVASVNAFSTAVSTPPPSFLAIASAGFASTETSLSGVGWLSPPQAAITSTNSTGSRNGRMYFRFILLPTSQYLLHLCRMDFGKQKVYSPYLRAFLCPLRRGYS